MLFYKNVIFLRYALSVRVNLQVRLPRRKIFGEEFYDIFG